MEINSVLLDQARLIETAIIEIRDHGQRIETVFAKYNLNYKSKTYYALKKRYDDHGIEGLISQKHKCGRKKKQQCDEYSFIVSLKKRYPQLTAIQVQEQLQKSLNKTLSKSQINKILRKDNLQNKIGAPKTKEPQIDQQVEEREINYAGLIFLMAAAHETGFNDSLADFQQDIISRVNENSEDTTQQLPNIEEDGVFSKDINGKFTTYAPDTRKYGEVSNRYKSVKERIKNRDLKKLRIVISTNQTLIRKNLAILSLPAITRHGRFTELNETTGNELFFFTGYDYRTSTIDKYMRELKYLQSSQELTEKMAGFWYKLWESKTADKIKQVCYYFDGNRKPLWSSYPIKQSKVSMVGRVMGCLEQVYIHSSNGHPLMLQTFSGGIHLPTAIKLLHSQMDRVIPHDVSRISIFDAAANSVDFYESFKDDEYFICVLDSDQYNQDLSDFKITNEYQTESGIYVEASKSLKNSKNRQLFKVRTPLYKKNNSEKYVAFVTNIPQEIMDAKTIVISYYQRWPCQENGFRDLNSGGNLRTNYGYGKTKVINVVVQNKKKYLQEQIQVKQSKIENLTQQQENIKIDIAREISENLQKIKENDHQIDELKKKIEADPTVANLRQFLNKLEKLFKQQADYQVSLVKKELQLTEKLKKLESQKKRNESLKQKHEKEFNRINGKEIVYENDTELDQILGIYKISYANLSAFVLKEYFDGMTLSLEKLVNKVYKRPGKIISTDEKKEVTIYLSAKDKKMSKLIADACERINRKELEIDNQLIKVNPIKKSFQEKKDNDEFTSHHFSISV